MPEFTIKNNLIILRKLKKDGTIPSEIIENIARTLAENKLLVLPVDCTYGVAARLSIENIQKLKEVSDSPNSVHLISSFKMLDSLAHITKLEYDFLHRVWPGELNIQLKSHKPSMKTSIRIPKSKYVLSTIEMIDSPLYYIPLEKSTNNCIYKKSEIIKNYSDKTDQILIIEEFCKEHTAPSIIDVSEGKLDILYEGRVSSDEIKSLYFLGKDDAPV